MHQIRACLRQALWASPIAEWAGGTPAVPGAGCSIARATLLLAASIGLAACRTPERSTPSPATTSSPAVTASTDPRPSSWTTLKPGLDVRRWNAQKLGDVHVVRLDPKRWELTLAAAGPSTPDGGLDRVETTARSAGAIAAVNGGFFDSAGAPMGLRVAAGKQHNPLRRADWGVFFVRDGVPRLVHTKDAKRAEGAEFAIQCGPRLVVDGRPMKLKPGLARRTVIGADRAGKAYLAVSLALLDLNDLAAALALAPGEGGLGLAHVLNLDGGPSTQMYVEAGDGAWNVAGGTGVADAVAVVARK